jgi:hypothetical protein
VIARTRSSRMTVARRLDRLSRRNLRVERVVADMAGGLTLHRGLDRFRRVRWTLSDGGLVDDKVGRLVIEHSHIMGVGDSLFPEIGELSQAFRYIEGPE